MGAKDATALAGTIEIRNTPDGNVEVTDSMLDAGAAVLTSDRFERGDGRVLVWNIFEAMARTALKEAQ